MKKLVSLACMVAMAMLFSCGGGTESEPGEDLFVPDTAEDDVQVPPEEVDENVCSPVCVAGFHCEDGQCVPDAAVCGDGQCEGEESCSTCAQDCGECAPACPDGKCNGTETCTTCPQDCGQCPPGCGNGSCDGTETCTTCPDDCGVCPPECGDGTCNGTENCETCEGDCGKCPLDCDPPCAAGTHCEEGKCVPDQVGPCQPSGNVANLKGCAEGKVDVTLKGVTVTCFFAKGYFVQDASGAVEIYVGDTWAYSTPVVGQVIDVHVKEYGNYKNQQEAIATDAPVVTGNADVEPMKLNVSSGTLPSEELESRVIKGIGFKVDTIKGSNLTVSYGTAAKVLFRADAPGTLCEGAKFDLASGVVTQYNVDYRLQSFLAMDIINVDISGCKVEPVMDDSNWGFEETAENDPPADFIKATAAFTAKWTAAQKHTGNNGCELAWTSPDNQDLVAGFYKPATEGKNVTFKLWGLDNDPAGRFRLCLEFFDANKVSIAKEYSSGYSVDGATWVELMYSKAAPAGSAFVRSFVRLYDVAEGWKGTATVHIDDWSVTVE
ncbi:MAG: hypothetical protein FJ109_07125 [Deltaproteobacteria bacterium]|nr:hypothetical protein [Deltaproteobacteria bacterium]